MMLQHLENPLDLYKLPDLSDGSGTPYPNLKYMTNGYKASAAIWSMSENQCVDSKEMEAFEQIIERSARTKVMA